jgi:hypothetical protein
MFMQKYKRYHVNLISLINAIFQYIAMTPPHGTTLQKHINRFVERLLN